VYLAGQMKIGWRETSARLATNVDALFVDMVEKIVFPGGTQQPQAAQQSHPGLSLKEQMVKKQ